MSREERRGAGGKAMWFSKGKRKGLVLGRNKWRTSPGEEPLAKQRIDMKTGSAGFEERHQLNTKHGCGKSKCLTQGSASIVCPGLSTTIQKKYGLIGERSAESPEGDGAVQGACPAQEGGKSRVYLG